jgi:hypothetical protein
VTFTPLTTSLAVGVGLGTVHFLAHNLAGDEDKFAEAGVETAGIATVIGGAVATYIVLSVTGVA